MNDDNPKTNRSILPVQIREMREKVSAPSGIVRVHESVVVSIVKKAACSVEGVVRLAGNSLVNNLADIVGSRKIFDRSISIVMGENSVSVDIRLVLKYGCNIPLTARNVQETVSEEIRQITGMKIESVNIIVADLDADESAANAEEATEENAGGSSVIEISAEGK
ncbi:MAG: Asp23/Gls24 family envelope stress response protein [Lentisphaeria bacterium]|nr:Asp23/Gls24 family envelope stress response protein [Lentisphaeria bacterium]